MSKCWYCEKELTTANYCDKHVGICTKCYNSMFKVVNEFVKGLTDKISDLEAKLAEKEKEIANLKGLVRERDKQIKNLKTNKKRVVEHKNKAKINFAVEQLEKVKEFVNNLYGEYSASVITNFIDKQIKQLKEKK